MRSVGASRSISPLINVQLVSSAASTPLVGRHISLAVILRAGRRADIDDLHGDTVANATD